MRYLLCCGLFHKEKILLEDKEFIERLRNVFFTKTPNIKSSEELKSLLSIEENNVLLLPIIRVENLNDVEKTISTFMNRDSVIMMIDWFENQLHIYQNATVEEAEIVYLPRFLEIYKIQFDNSIFNIKNIENITNCSVN